MANIAINSTPTRVQYVATGGQTEFSYSFPIKEGADLKVYLRAAGTTADDAADILTITTDYTVSGANTASGGTVTLQVAATNGDIVTIVGDKPIDRNAIYDQSVTLTKADLNNDFNDNVMYDKQVATEFDELGLKYNRSERITPTYREDNARLPILNNNEMWIGRGDAGDENDDVTTVLVSGIDGITFNSTDFLIGTADDIYPDAQVLGSLSNGILKNTTVAGTGTVSIAAQGTDYYAPGGTDIAVTDGGTGASTAGGARTNLGLEIGVDVQAYNAGLTNIAGLAKTDGNVIVGDGANWVAESGATARASLGLTIGTDVLAYDAEIQQIADLADPNADRILFWDDSAGSYAFLTAGDNLTITGTTIDAAGSGVEGPVSSTDNAVARWDGTDGLLIQDSSVIIDDSDVVSGITQLNVDDLRLDGGTLSSTNTDGAITLDPNGTGAIELGSSLVSVEQYIGHAGDADTFIEFGTDAQDYQTGGSSRLDISNSGVRLGGANSRVTTILDEDNMASDSATSLATQQSIKAYVDAVPVGDVVGPGSSTDNAVARWDGASGALLQDSVVTINNAGQVDGVTRLAVDNILINGNDITSTDTNGNIEIQPDGTGEVIIRADTVKILESLVHQGDINNKFVFGNDTQDFQTGGSSRLDISDSGVRLGGANSRVTAILDEDDMTSDSDTALATQQSIKAYVDANAGGGSGDVTGPASATDNAIARFDSTTGKLIQNSVVTADDVGVIAGITQLNTDNIRIDGNTISSTDTNGNINLAPDGSGVVAASEISLTTDLAVTHGGTGVSSATAYELLAGGTTATGAFQSVGAGTSGQFLISNGAGALPSFQTPSLPSQFLDGDFRIQNTADDTKEIAFDASGITTATTRTITMPDANIDLTPTTGDFQASDAGLTDIAGLAVTDGNIIVGDGANWVAESGATARTSLGLSIGTDVQAQDAGLQDIADLADPDADRLLFWDDSAGEYAYLEAGSGLTITGTTITASGGGGSADAVTKDVTQASHGFSVGDVAYLSSTNYFKANAIDVSTAEAVGMVSAVADANNFTLTTHGHVTGLSSLTAGTVYYLSANTAGEITGTAPTNPGDIVKPMLVADTTTSGYLINYRGNVIPSADSGQSGMTLLATASASSSASVDFDNLIDSTYDTYMLTISGLVPATDNTTAYVRVGTGSGPTYQTTNYNYGTYMVTDTGGTSTGGSSSTSQIHLQVTRGQGNAAGEAFGATMYVFQAADTSLRTSVRFQTVQDSADGNAQGSWGFGFWNDTTSVTSIQVFMSSGNITSGEFSLYGMNN